MAWGSLGDVTFEPLAGPTGFSSSQGKDVARHALLGRKPLLQAVADQLEELQLQVRFHWAINANIELDLRTLLDSMRQAEAVDLVLGDAPDAGIYAGRYLITKLQHTVLEFRGGIIMHAEASLTLEEYQPPPDLEVSSRVARAPALRTRATGQAPPSSQAYTRAGDGQIVPRPPSGSSP